MPAQPTVMIANEPTSYREVLAEMLPVLRPALRVEVVAPDELDAVLARRCPRLVVCSRLSAAVRAHARSWIVLYPEGEDRAEVRLDGADTIVPRPTMDDLLAAVDAALPAGRP